MTTITGSPNALNTIRVGLGVGGLLALIAGVLVLAWPGRTAAVITAIIAIYALVAGLVYVAVGIFSKVKGGWSRVGHILLGVVFLIAGAVALANLAQTTAWLAVFLGIAVGILWIVEGITALSTLGGSPSKVWTIIFAILSIIAGIILLTSPFWGAAVLWWLLGISLIVLGIVNVVRAFTFGAKAAA